MGLFKQQLFFGKNLTTTLKSWGFTINPYNWRVANKMVNGQQSTIVWHVEDLKISHVDKQVVTTLINKLNKQYGKTASGQDVPLTVKPGKVHEYLGTRLDYQTKGKI